MLSISTIFALMMLPGLAVLASSFIVSYLEANSYEESKHTKV